MPSLHRKFCSEDNICDMLQSKNAKMPKSVNNRECMARRRRENILRKTDRGNKNEREIDNRKNKVSLKKERRIANKHTLNR